MDRIRQLRKERGLSQVKLAVMADMDPATLNRLERGSGNPNLKTLQRIADALGVSVAEIVEDASPKAQAPLPLEYGPSLEELHAEAGCATDWLVKPEDEWRAAWAQIPSPQEAVLAVFDLGDEYSAIRKRIAEIDPDMTLPHRLVSGPYKQAFVRWIYGIQNAHSCGVAAGKIAIADTLNDLVKEVGLEDEMRKREHEREKQGADPLEGIPLAS